MSKSVHDSANPMQVGGAILLIVTAFLLAFMVWFVVSPKEGYQDHKKLKFGIHAAATAVCLAAGVTLMVLGFNETKPEETNPAGAMPLL